MDIQSYFIYLFIMAGVTYLIRALPFALVKNQIKSRFFQSFLYYVPYAVLSAMTFPAILYATGSMISAAAGLVAAVVMAYFRRGLLQVAMTACTAVLLADVLLGQLLNL